MAEPIPSFIFGGNTGLTEEAMKTRRAIAVALSRRMKAPQTVGEGMTYLGESLNDALGTIMLNRQEQAFGAQQAEEAKKLAPDYVPPAAAETVPAPAASPPPAVAATPSPAPPAPTGPIASDPNVMRQMIAQASAGAEIPPPELPPQAPVQVAALNGAGGTMTDAPPPEAARLGGNPPIVTNDIKPALVAEASGVAGGRPGPLDKVPVPPPPSTVPPGLSDKYEKPLPFPPRPPVPPMNDMERRGYAAQAPGNSEAIKLQGQKLMEIGRTQRMKAHDDAIKQWEREQAAAEQNQAEWTQRRSPEGRIKQKAAEDQAAYESWVIGKYGHKEGAAPFEKAILDSVKNKPIIENTSAALNQARKLLLDPAFLGPTGPTRAAINNALQFIGVPPNPALSDTQAFQAVVKELYGPLRNNVLGPGAQSNAEGRTLESAVGGNISLQPEAIKTILGSIEKQNWRAALDHQKDILFHTGDDPRQQKVWFGKAGLNMHDIAPQDQVDFLKANASNPDIIKKFNEAMHTPGLAEEILKRGRR